MAIREDRQPAKASANRQAPSPDERPWRGYRAYGGVRRDQRARFYRTGVVGVPHRVTGLARRDSLGDETWRVIGVAAKRLRE